MTCLNFLRHEARGNYKPTTAFTVWTIPFTSKMSCYNRTKEVAGKFTLWLVISKGSWWNFRSCYDTDRESNFYQVAGTTLVGCVQQRLYPALMVKWQRWCIYFEIKISITMITNSLIHTACLSSYMYMDPCRLNRVHVFVGGRCRRKPVRAARSRIKRTLTCNTQLEQRLRYDAPIQNMVLCALCHQVVLTNELAPTKETLETEHLGPPIALCCGSAISRCCWPKLTGILRSTRTWMIMTDCKCSQGLWTKMWIHSTWLS